jgi:hypothetical protein
MNPHRVVLLIAGILGTQCSACGGAIYAGSITDQACGSFAVQRL